MVAIVGRSEPFLSAVLFEQVSFSVRFSWCNLISEETLLVPLV